jgi:tetratricopeptide (TPR) repeat protein
MMEAAMSIRGVRTNRLLIALLPLLLVFGAGVGGCAQNDEWKTLNAEAESLYKQGQYDRARVLAKKALEVAEQARGPDHPDVALTLENLAELYKATNRLTEAEALEKRAEAIRAIKR